MYRVHALLRGGRASARPLVLSRVGHCAWCDFSSAAAAAADSRAAPPPAATATPAAAPSPRIPHAARRRPTVSQSLAAGWQPPAHFNLSSAKTTPRAPIEPAHASFYQWRKMPDVHKWAHLGTGAFPLVPATATGDRLSHGDSSLSPASMHLAQGVKMLPTMFAQPATIHRIIGFESDLYEESKRDSTATAEVAFVGRSNVGKSSLLNALLVNGGLRKQLATTSKTPGRTQLLFMFSFKDARDTRLVDCPGYGFAKVKKEKAQAWNVLMGLYMRRRNRQGILKRVMVLIDIRRGIGPLDEQFMQFLESEGIAYQVVLTKVDLLTPRNFSKQLEEVRDHLRCMPRGKFTTEALKDEYDARIGREMKGADDGEGDEEDQAWQADVNSGKYAVSRELPRGSDPLPEFSCCVPVIHAVSSRQEVGLQALQHSLTKMLTLEKNFKRRPYQRDDTAVEGAGELTEGVASYDDLPSDGMDNLSAEDEQDAWAPPIPVSHYEEATPERRQRERSRERKQASTLVYSSSKDRKRSKFGARSGARGFATQARPRKPRAASTPPPATSKPDGPPVTKRARSKKTETDAALADASPAKETKKAPTAPKVKRAKSVPPAEKPDALPAASSDATPATSATRPSPSSPNASSSSSADAHLGSIYQKKSQRQHILDRSETYIGSMHHQHSAQWVYSEVDGDPTRPAIVQRECRFVPSLVHIFDEILVNAADNQHRVSPPVPGERTDPAAPAVGQTMSTIRVDIDPVVGRISVYNDGAAIPVATHPTEHIPIPELIFGHLLTSSNYNDKEQRFTGGRHGYGAKLTNIFSREFQVEVQDVARARRYRQVFTNNMGERSAPRLESFADLLQAGESKKALASNYTRISFIPDFARFNEQGLTEDTVALMKRRVYDVAACVNTNIQVAKQTMKAKGGDPAAAAGASVKKIKVYLNGHLVEADTFPKYLDLFPSAVQVARDGASLEHADGKWVFSNVNEKWQVAVGPNVAVGGVEMRKTATGAAGGSDGGQVTSLPPATRDISFVNSISTSRGGTHVTHVADRITRAIIDHILKYHKTITKEMLPPSLVKAHMSLLVNCKIPNPSFSSQTKESLMTPVADFKSECTLSQSFLQTIVAPSTGIVPSIVESVVARQQVDLLRKSRANASKRGKLLHIPKLDDALWAGSADPAKVKQTTLILTEGDSAKALVLSSLSILGRDKFGVFPLKGKMLNVRDAPLKQVMENAEIQNLLAILGLEIGTRYTVADDGGIVAADDDARRQPSKPLRYGRIMLMTDQDHDGSHIKGLFMNLLHTYWPELLRGSNFLEEFVTAIIKVRVHGKAKEVLSFQTQAEFEAWKARLPTDVLLNHDKFKKLYTVKYYKGLGTNTSEEGREYFRNIANHRVKFVWTMELAQQQQQQRQEKERLQLQQQQQKSKQLSSSGSASSVSLLPPPSASASEWLRLAFSKDQTDARKEWLQTRWHDKLFVDTTSRRLAIEDFINKELIVFSHADNIRSIPSVLDGFKPVQRKILYGCFKKGLKGEIKVAQLSGYISEQTVYHHGEVSLQSTIIHMAQSFIGSNNLALLVGAGQFGSRHTGGKDAAAARYIFTNVAPMTRTLFHPSDDALLTYKEEDGFPVEPEFYLPIIPMVLANGADGIGTGFSTAVPTYHPLHLVDNLRLWLQGRELTPLHPWTRGWRGVLRPSQQVGDDITNYLSEGIVHEVSPTVVEVRELPLGRLPEEFKASLASLQADGAIKRFQDQCTDERICYRIEMNADQASAMRSVGPLKLLKLTSSLSLNNMHLFNGHNLITKYASAVDILREFAPVRLEYYRRRREYLLISLQVDLQRVTNKKRFISLVTSGELVVYNRKKADLVHDLAQRQFDTAQQLLPRFPVYEDHREKKPIKWTNTVEGIKGGAASPAAIDADSYDYLLQLPLSTLTAERLESLQAEYDTALAQVDTLTKSTAKSLWLHDLQKFEDQWKATIGKEAQTKTPTMRIEEAEIDQ